MNIGPENLKDLNKFDQQSNKNYEKEIIIKSDKDVDILDKFRLSLSKKPILDLIEPIDKSNFP